MKNNFLLFIFISFTSVFKVYSQTSLSKRIDSALSNVVKPNEPGVSVGVARGGKLIYNKGFGMADHGMQRKNSPETPFNIASNSKQITAACIYILEEQGKLKTTDKLSKYFEGWPKYADSITINHLIHHESGLMDYITLRALMNLGEFKLEKSDYQLLLGQEHLNFSPGKEYSYSNSGYFLLSLIVKSTSGQDLAVFASRNIFQPLHMNKTAFSRSHEVKGKANGYILIDEKYIKSNPTDTTIGQGNVYSTIADWNKWLSEMKTQKLLGSNIWSKMLSVSDTSRNYGGGLLLSKYDGKDMIFHSGDIEGYHSKYYYFPKEDDRFIIFSNNDNVPIKDIFKRIYGVLYKDESILNNVAEKSIETPQIHIPFDTLNYIGSFQLKPDVVITFSKKDGFLHAEQLWNGSSYNLLPKSSHEFYTTADTNVVFTFKDVKDGLVQNLEILQDGEISVLKRVNWSMDLNDYCGKFVNSGLETTYSIILKNNTLELYNKTNPLKFTSIDVDSFTFDFGNIHFTRDKDNVVKEMILDHPRVNNLRFVKVND